jgi:signal transduction histidine kinase
MGSGASGEAEWRHLETGSLLPATLTTREQAVRRALWRRRVLAVCVLLFLAAPPAAWIFLARSSAPADGTLTYPTSPRWSASQGAGLAQLYRVDTRQPAGSCVLDELDEDDGVVEVGDVPLDDWVRGKAGSVPPRLGDEVTYTVDQHNDPRDCTLTVVPTRYPWLEAAVARFPALLLVMVMWLTASFALLQRPRDPAARAYFALAFLVPFGGTAWPAGTQVIDLVNGPRLWPFVWGEIANALLWGAVLHFVAVFPRPIPWLEGRPRRLAAVYALPFALHLAHMAVREPGEVIENLAGVMFPFVGSDAGLRSLSYTIPVSIEASRTVPAIAFMVLLWQYRHAERPGERDRTRWVTYTFLIVAAAYLVFWQIPSWLTDDPLIDWNWLILGMIAVPLALSAAVLRYGILDLQVVLRRSLVYGLLTAALVVLPATLTIAIARLTDADLSGRELALVVALVVAGCFQALRTRLRRRVSRLIFGERDDPYELVAQLGGRLQSTVAAESLLESVAETVARALRLPYVAIELRGPDGVVDVQEYGQRQGEALGLPLVSHGEEVGRLLLDPGARREPFGPADRKLIGLLTQQVGIAAHSVLLAGRLQRSLHRAVTVREEERRRLRRDIHDGLGPMLSATKMQLELARKLLATRPDSAAAILDGLVDVQQAVITDVRRLVEGLRPPVLDQLGLVPAIRERATTLSDRSDDDTGLTITVDADADVDVEPLPAAVEVAAYRVVLEALTNVVRHAQATECRVRLWRSDALLVEVRDNGRGMPDVLRPGVGIGSMRERASELGGSCVVTNNRDGGTIVRARFPIGVD